MGMFDNVNLPFKCPECGFEQEKPTDELEGIWQTKDTACVLYSFVEGDELKFKGGLVVEKGSIEVHNACPSCGAFVSAKAEVVDNKLTGGLLSQKTIELGSHVTT